jgi:hypothetical protein
MLFKQKLVPRLIGKGVWEFEHFTNGKWLGIDVALSDESVVWYQSIAPSRRQFTVL